MTDWRHQALLPAVFIGGAIALAVMHPTAWRPAPHQVRVSYDQPVNPAHAGMRQRLQERRVLEDLRDFLSPVRLPASLTIRTASCGDGATYNPRTRTITMCYEFVDRIRSLLAKQDAARYGLTTEDVLAGSFVDIMLHEVAHALFHLLDIPVLGREEDAADALAAFILVQFGPDFALRTVIGAALHFRADAEDRRVRRIEASNDARDSKRAEEYEPRRDEFAAVHGLPEQRYVNLLCIAYGRYQEAFKPFVNDTDLPPDRRRFCRDEYTQLRRAFLRLVDPHVDPRLKDAVLKRKWLAPPVREP